MKIKQNVFFTMLIVATVAMIMAFLSIERGNLKKELLTSPAIYVEGKLYYFTEEKKEASESSEDIQPLLAKPYKGLSEPLIEEGDTNLPFPDLKYYKKDKAVFVLWSDVWHVFKEESAIKNPVDFQDYLQEVVGELQQKLLENQILSLARDEYFDFSNKAMRFLSIEERLSIVKSQWEYCMRINGELIPRDGKVIVKDSELTVGVREKSLQNPVMSLDEYNQGGISGDSLLNHVDFNGLTPKRKDSQKVAGLEKHVLAFELDDSQDDYIITITEEFMVKLGLDTTKIVISKER